MIQATNDFVFIIREKTQTEQSGLIIPSGGREKPHSGKVISIGSLVQDKTIKGGKNKTALFHKGTGFEIEYGGETYLVIESGKILAIV